MRGPRTGARQILQGLHQPYRAGKPKPAGMQSRLDQFATVVA